MVGMMANDDGECFTHCHPAHDGNDGELMANGEYQSEKIDDHSEPTDLGG